MLTKNVKELMNTAGRAHQSVMVRSLSQNHPDEAEKSPQSAFCTDWWVVVRGEVKTPRETRLNKNNLFMKYGIIIFSSLLFMGCGQKKQSPGTDLLEEAKDNVQFAIQQHDSLKRAEFIEDYAALGGEERDSIFFVTFDEYREGTDFNDLAKQNFEAARRKGIKFKACIILDNKGNELGHYE